MGGNSFSAVQQQNRKRVNSVLQKQMKMVAEAKNQCKLTEHKARFIIQKKAFQLVQCLNNGELTSLEIICAFAQRSGTYGKDLKLITQTLFSQALSQAKQCDQKRKITNKKNWTLNDGEYNEDKYLPPLFGIPVSVKEMFDVQGLTSSCGLSTKLIPKDESSPIIFAFKNTGVIPFVKSNVPQIGMTFQSMNDVWGRAQNPWNRQRTPGGSSGGESGLISGYCSPLGIGSDIGGSIRIPAQFCGIYAIKPTSTRLSSSFHMNFTTAITGAGKGIPLCLGPMARSVTDLVLQSKILYDTKAYGNQTDPYIADIPFNCKEFIESSTENKKYRIGYFNSIEDLEPSKASIRALNEVMQALKSDGHQLVQIKVPNQAKILKSFYFNNLSSGAENYRQLLNGQKPAVQYQKLFSTSQLWGPIRGLAGLIMSKKSPRINYYLLSNMGHKKAIQVLRNFGQIQQFKQTWIKYWRQNQLDFVICPGFGCQAVPHSGAKNVTLAAGYTFLWNVLDTPTGAVPVTVVKQNQQEYQSRFNDEITEELQKNARGSVGMPVGIQVIGLPLQQQRLLGFMKKLQDKIDFCSKYKPKFDQK